MPAIVGSELIHITSTLVSDLLNRILYLFFINFLFKSSPTNTDLVLNSLTKKKHLFIPGSIKNPATKSRPVLNFPTVIGKNV